MAYTLLSRGCADPFTQSCTELNWTEFSFTGGCDPDSFTSTHFSMEAHSIFYVVLEIRFPGGNTHITHFSVLEGGSSISLTGQLGYCLVLQRRGPGARHIIVVSTWLDYIVKFVYQDVGWIIFIGGATMHRHTTECMYRNSQVFSFLKSFIHSII